MLLGLLSAPHQSLEGPEDDTGSRFQLLCSVGWGGPSETGWKMGPELASTLRLGGWQGQVRGGEKSLERQSQPNGTVEVCLRPTSPGFLPSCACYGHGSPRQISDVPANVGTKAWLYISLLP